VDRRRLVVVRHGKAEPYAAKDHARRLTARGRADAAAVGRYLASVDVRPDRALVSDAARTIETWQQLRAALDAEPREEITRELYGASADDVVELVRRLPGDVWTALYVGHNPTAEQLAGVLHDTEGDPAVLTGLLAGFPTCAVAVFELEGDWADLAEGRARLTHFHVPKDG
jgi:phosphohistidine phosphatase